MTDSIQGAWLRLSGQLASQGWPSDMLEKLETIFYGGASAATFLVMARLDPESRERVLPLLDEIRGFAEEMERSRR